MTANRKPKPNLKKCEECKRGHHGFCEMMSCRCTYINPKTGRHPKFITDTHDSKRHAAERR